MSLRPLLACAVLGCLALTGPAGAAPRPVSPAERAAVALALTYVEDGPAGWWERLAAGSPLRELGREGALAALEVAAGPPAGAVWELQTVVERGWDETAVFVVQYPSGVDAALFLDLVEEGGGWALTEVRTWAEAGPGAVAEPPVREEAPAPEPSGLLPVSLPPGALPMAALAAAALLLLATLVLLRRRSPAAVLVFAFAVAFGVVGWVHHRRLAAVEDAGPPVVEAPPAASTLADLVPLRRALAGEDQAAVDGALAAAPADGAMGVVARLWEAQYRLQGGDLEAAAALLDALPMPSGHPLAEVLRGRLAYLRGDGVATAAAYERALGRLPDFDGLGLEAAEAALLLGFESRAQSKLERLAAYGSRRGEVYYWLSRFTAVAQKTDEALEHLRTAYRLDPLERGELLGDRIYAFLVREGELFDLLRLINPEEPAMLAPDLGEEALASPPPGLAASYCGGRVRLVLGDSEVLVPGGTRLAPPEAVPEDAAARRRRIEGEVLADLPELIRAARAPSSLAQPALRQRVATAADALARRNRWVEVLEITEGFAAHPENLPSSLAQLRAEALHRSEREVEARRLLIQLAKNQKANHRKDPDTLYRLATFLAEAAEYDLAVQVAQTADAQSPTPPTFSLVPRLRMERRLAESFGVVKSEHFQIRYPAVTSELYVRALAEVLEEQYRRLERWIPYRSYRPIEVDLFPFQEYARVYDPARWTLGMYDGKVRMPFAEVPSLHPKLISIFTHEIAHAMLAATSDDQAPDWFQEGLAQHVELVQERINPIPDYFQRGSYLSFPLLEPILANDPELELLGVAYEEAMWVLHFVERRHGVEGIRGLIQAFTRGRTTEEALEEVFGRTPAEFDADFRRWALNEAPRTWTPRG